MKDHPVVTSSLRSLKVQIEDLILIAKQKAPMFVPMLESLSGAPISETEKQIILDMMKPLEYNNLENFIIAAVYIDGAVEECFMRGDITEPVLNRLKDASNDLKTSNS